MEHPNYDRMGEESRKYIILRQHWGHLVGLVFAIFVLSSVALGDSWGLNMTTITCSLIALCSIVCFWKLSMLESD